MNKKICSRCIYDSSIPKIEFDEKGECNYCKMSDDLAKMYSTGKPEGYKKFGEILNAIKKAGKGKKYDCVVGASGGTDSSFMLHLAVKEWGLRPLAVHYDNTWNTSYATENIRKVTTKLNIDLYTHVIDNKESDDIIKSFFKSGVAEIDAPTDLAFAEVHYRAASKYGIKYILEGHTFMEEGVSPLSDVYFDGRYISSINKKYGTMPIKTYPLMTFFRFMKWVLYKRIKKIRPLWYLDYSKENARKTLEKVYGWKYYGGHHLENRLTAFTHQIYLPKKFEKDLRNLSLAASVRSGSMSHEKALEIYLKQ